MPSSAPVFNDEIGAIIMSEQPKTALDVGIGFGLYGYMMRQYADVIWGRIKPDEWACRITGVEAFPEYIHDASRYIYDEIIERPIEDVVELLPTFDLIFCGDMIEHLPKEQGAWVLNCFRKISKRLVVKVPLGLDWEQGEVFGNKYEEHKSVWTELDFMDDYTLIKETFRGKEIGLAIA
jgi:hypothetical protein